MSPATVSRSIRISIHSPHARGDLETVHKLTDTIKFQSTPLMRGETLKSIS